MEGIENTLAVDLIVTSISIVILYNSFSGSHLTNTLTYWGSQHWSKAGAEHEKGEPEQSFCGRYLKMLLHIWDARCVDGRAESAGSINIRIEIKAIGEDVAYIVKAHVAGTRA